MAYTSTTTDSAKPASKHAAGSHVLRSGRSVMRHRQGQFPSTSILNSTHTSMASGKQPATHCLTASACSLASSYCCNKMKAAKFNQSSYMCVNAACIQAMHHHCTKLKQVHKALSPAVAAQCSCDSCRANRRRLAHTSPICTHNKYSVVPNMQT